jgi:phage terminase large subunit-like protein
MATQQSIEAKLKKLELLEARKKLRDGLPHLYGFPWYPWARKFHDSTNKDNFLVAANQISKSSTLIRKNIHWATEKSLWTTLWPRRRPLQFWYLYPTRDVTEVELEEKWKPEFLPKGEYKDSPIYGWKDEWKHGQPFAIHFNSGVSLYFKTYSQSVTDLQTGTCDMISFDEELPADLYDELNLRRAATDGYLNGVFTATLAQEFWRLAMEEHGAEEKFKDALKMQVSMYDCLFYEDGTPSHWTPEKIQRIINSCRSEAEVQRRVFGRFVADTGLRYASFSRTVNVKKPVPFPPDWRVYSGVDIGGGGSGHPSAICFVAVSPDYKQGRVFAGWRGGGEVTTSSDVLDRYLLMRAQVKIPIMAQYYDWHAKDFSTIATRLNEPFLPAEKSHEIGESMLNVLFKNEMLSIDAIPELDALCTELTTNRQNVLKNKAKDDFIDALRYSITKIPWNWEAIKSEQIQREVPHTAKELSEIELRRKGFSGEPKEGYDNIEEEFAAWNELYEV